MPSEITFGLLPARVASAGVNAADLQKACGPQGNRSWLCVTVYRLTGNIHAADVADAFTRPVQIAFVILLAFVATLLVHRLVHRLVRRLKAGPLADASSVTRRAQRAETVAAVVRSVAAIAIWSIAIVIIIGNLGIDLAPLLAGAGVIGVVLGFGAQTVVRDFLAGIFMLLEDQYGVGDVIDVGLVSTATGAVAGTVEGVSLRVTRVRDVEGIVWHVPNGEIRRVGNKGKGWSRALLDIAVVPSTPVTAASELIATVAHDLRRDDAWHARIVAEPEVWGVEDLTGDRVVIRLVVTTRPLQQWNVARELRARIKHAFDDAGIELAVPQLITYRATGSQPQHLDDGGHDPDG